MRSRRVILDLLAILVVGVVLLATVQIFRPPSGTGARSTARVPSRSGVVDPEPYRAYIDSVETAVYAESTDVTTGGRISVATQDLAEAVLTREPRLMGTRAHQELFVFAMSIAVDEFPFTPPDADSIQRAWEVVRGAVFQKADWFRGER